MKKFVSMVLVVMMMAVGVSALAAGQKLTVDEAKQIAKDWDAWTRERNPDVRPLWMKLYRALPYPLYRAAYKSFLTMRKMYLKIKG